MIDEIMAETLHLPRLKTQSRIPNLELHRFPIESISSFPERLAVRLIVTYPAVIPDCNACCVAEKIDQRNPAAAMIRLHINLDRVYLKCLKSELLVLLMKSQRCRIQGR